VLYRVFPFAPDAPPSDEGGALFAPRELQGRGRHDNPAAYTALYLSRTPDSAVAERLQVFRGRSIDDRHLRRADGLRYAMAAIDDSGIAAPVDLDDPEELRVRALRPSRVATTDRSITQPIALAAFDDGASGIAWWSTIEALWTNVTLFAERCRRDLRVGGEPEPLTATSPVVLRVAERLGVGVHAS
jgi:RES domain